MIFATTTPVPESEAGRIVGDDAKYNAGAVAVMKKHDITVNDLHAVMAGKMPKYAKKAGDVHFKEEGSAMLAKQVAKSIVEHLPPRPGKPYVAGASVLFDGTNFDGWIVPEGSWVIESDSSMVCKMDFVNDKKTVLVDLLD